MPAARGAAEEDAWPEVMRTASSPGRTCSSRSNAAWAPASSPSQSAACNSRLDATGSSGCSAR